LNPLFILGFTMLVPVGPFGGPTSLVAQEAPSAATAPVKIYLLAGQSNMVGYTSAEWVAKEAPKLARPRADVWCYWRGKCRPLGPGAGHQVGPELAFGHGIGDALEAPVLLCKFAVGGTTLHEAWRSPSAVVRAGGEIGHLYKRMMKRFHRILADPGKVYPAAKGRRFEIAGFIWLQGENDCFGKREDHYEANLRDLIKDVRVATGTKGLPVAVIQINDSGAWDNGGGGGPTVRAAQAKVADEDPNAVLIVTKDLDEGYHYADGDHVTIGRRVVPLMLPFARRAQMTDPAAIARARAGLDSLFYPGRGPLPPKPHLHLSDLDWESGVAGWGGAPRKNLTIADAPLRIDGVTYEKGIGTHAESTLVYGLDPSYRRFVAIAGIDDEVGDRDVCSVVFRVKIDGKVVAESVVMKGREKWHFDVPLSGDGKKLTLEVLEGDSGVNSDHADWVDAGFLLKGR